MAGIGSKLDTKIYPRESFGRIQPFVMGDYSSNAAYTGGGAMSRAKQNDQDERRVRTQERLTLDDVRWSDMRKKVPLMGRVPSSKIADELEEKRFQEVFIC